MPNCQTAKVEIIIAQFRLLCTGNFVFFLPARQMRAFRPAAQSVSPAGSGQPGLVAAGGGNLNAPRPDRFFGNPSGLFDIRHYSEDCGSNHKATKQSRNACDCRPADLNQVMGWYSEVLHRLLHNFLLRPTLPSLRQIQRQTERMWSDLERKSMQLHPNA